MNEKSMTTLAGFAIAVLLASCCSSSAAEPQSQPAGVGLSTRAAGADRPDIPGWFKQSRAFYCPFANSGAGASLMKFKVGGGLTDSLKNFREMPKLLEDARKLGTNVIYLVDYWEGGYEYKSTYEPYAQCGGDEAFRDGIAAVHKQGGRVILYLEAFIISRRTEFGRKVGPDWAMMDEHGRFYSYYDTGDRFYLMHPGEESGWTAYLADLAGRMTEKYKIDGVHLDSYGLQWDWRDYNPKRLTGKDPKSFNRGAVNLVKRVRAAMRQHNPEAVVMLEGAEHTELLDACDGAQIESLTVLKSKPWWKDRKYPIFTSSFEIMEMKAIVDEGYQLAISPWWLRSEPRGRDEKILAAKTDKRNRFDQIEALNRYNNLLVANGVDVLPPGSSEQISRSIIEQLNRLKWQGSFVNPALSKAVRAVMSRYEQQKDNLPRTPADQINDWLRNVDPTR